MKKCVSSFNKLLCIINNYNILLMVVFGYVQLVNSFVIYYIIEGSQATFLYTSHHIFLYYLTLTWFSILFMGTE
jgi:hypothetical protein